MARSEAEVAFLGAMNQILYELANFATGRLRPNDPFFKAGDDKCRATERKGVFDEDDEELCHGTMAEFPCSVPNCNAKFDMLLQFEMHFNSLHRFPCATCRKQLPSAHLLDLHVSEKHDSFFKAMSERQPMYQCLKEDCGQKFNTPDDRRDHCISQHKFPHNFRFDDSFRKAKPSTSNESAMETDEPSSHNPPKAAPKMPGRGGKRARMWYSQRPRESSPATTDATFSSAVQELKENLPCEEMS